MHLLKKISFWASKNVKTSIAIITCCHLLLFFTALHIGWLLYAHELIVNNWVAYVLCGVFISLLIAAPGLFWLSPKSKTNYLTRKSFEFSVVLIGFLMSIVLGNQLPDRLNLYPRATFKATLTAVNIQQGKKEVVEGQLVKRKFKSWVKERVEKVRKWHRTSGEKAEKAFLIILGVLLIGALLFGVTILSCSVACSYGSGAGLLVAILGVLAILGLSFLIFGGINRSYKRQVEGKT
ncbi:MAG: hypothetical protein MRY78_13475 [Saprospiraceae bacterium]|nr:hypothetical protein [Saprospiraceae bacterium]